MDNIKNNINNEFNNEYYQDLFKQIYLAIYDNNINLLIKLIEKTIEHNNNKYIYLDYLLNPSIYKYVKIPSIIKLPTYSIQLHKIVDYNVNEDGNIGVMFNPFFLYDDNLYNYDNYNNRNKLPFYNNNGDKYTYQYIINNPEKKNWNDFYTTLFLSSLSINTSTPLPPYTQDETILLGDTWYPININQETNIISSYRLVSAEIIVRYTGPETEASGNFYGAIIQSSNNYINGNIGFLYYDDDDDSNLIPGAVPSLEFDGSTKCNLDKFNKLDTLYSSYYYKQKKCNEGIKLVYFPLDNSDEEFIPLLNQNNLYYYNVFKEYYINYLLCKKNYNDKFNFLIIGTNLPPNIDKKQIQIEIICNFECFFKPEYANYISPNQTNIKLSKKEKNDVINIINKNNIFNANENTFLNIKNNEY